MKNLIAATVLVASISAISQPAAADELILETAVSTSYFKDPSFDAVSDRNEFSEWALSAAWGFDQLAGLQLGMLFQAMPGRLSEDRFGGDVFVKWGRQRLLATAGWGADIWWFRPNATLGVGYAHQFLSLSFDPRLKDSAHDLTGQMSGGLDLNIPVRWGFVGFTTDVGYQLQTVANFDELRNDRKAFDAEYEPDEDPWTRARSDFGKMKTSGVFWSVGVNVTFAL